MSARLAGLAFVLCTSAVGDPAKELRSGVWAGDDPSTLRLPASRYQAYLVGEMHGLKQIEGIVGGYLVKLQQSGLRDAAIEEDSVYEREAQAYVAGKIDTIPEELCLRAGVLEVLRHLNEGRRADRLIRVHLVDVDSPAIAIRRHLTIIKEQVAGGTAVHVPEVAAIKARGLKTVEELKRLPVSGQLLRELRTVEHSIRAYQEGFEAGTGQSKGSPHLEDREEAIASNVRDLLRDPDCPGVLALYGSDHVSKARRTDGGPKRDRDFAPMALRLEQAGLRVFSVVTFPLSGRWCWRGRQGEMVWTVKDSSLANGETLDRVLAAAQQPSLLCVDPRRERIRLASRDVSAFAVDAFLLIASATPMENRCPVR